MQFSPFIDFQKAFDLVYHVFLWEALKRQRDAKKNNKTYDRNIYKNAAGRVKN